MAVRAKFPPVCVALGLPNADALLDQALREVANGEQFFEFRLDHLSDPRAGADVISRLRKSYPEATILATCRHRQYHGQFDGSFDDQIAILQRAVAAGAQAVDVEVEVAEKRPAGLADLQRKTFLIVSFHDFERTPALLPVVKRLQKQPADAIKIATTARKPSDAARLLAAQKLVEGKPCVLLAMGSMGAVSRILASAFGSLYTYAAPADAPGTAPGQVRAQQLRALYRVGKFSRAAKIFGVIADPIGHSLSPVIHNRAFQTKRMDAVYLPFHVPTGQVADFRKLAEELPVCGFSVTIPHKQRILRQLDWIDPLAKRIGAVNTVWRKAGKWRGANTDVAGVVEPLKKRMRLSKLAVLIAGNGGAARAAAFALRDAGAQVSITGRNSRNVQALARSTGTEPLTVQQAESRDFDVVVHATPMGMHPAVGSCFFRDRIPAPLVFDMVYNPLETELLKRARAQGSQVIQGYEMFLEQAVRQFEIWTSEAAPRAAMEKAVLEALQG